MIVLLSPAKTLDFEQTAPIDTMTEPIFKTESNKLISILREESVEGIQKLMSISEALADLNYQRYRTFKKRNADTNSKAAIYAFKGDVYQGFEAESLGGEEINFAQEHVRILSGLYGVLRPLDAMQPYRLEMGTKLKTESGNNLYQFWGSKIAKQLNKELKAQGSDLIVNLASNEYFKAVDQMALKASVIDVDFREIKNGEAKFVSFFAKKARGTMTKYIVENQISDPSDLRGFDCDGYRYEENGSTDQSLLFVRD